MANAKIGSPSLDVAAFKPDGDLAFDGLSLGAIFRGAGNGEGMEASQKSGD